MKSRQDSPSASQAYDDYIQPDIRWVFWVLHVRIANTPFGGLEVNARNLGPDSLRDRSAGSKPDYAEGKVHCGKK